MDKQDTQLDPKLKEAYDRVMGTVVTPQAQSAPQSATTPPPPPPAQSATVQVTTQSTPAAEKVGFVNTASKKKKGVSPVIVTLGIIILLVAYALVWIKIFNLKLF